jgi:hypothetical protein
VTTGSVRSHVLTIADWGSAVNSGTMAEVSQNFTSRARALRASH